MVQVIDLLKDPLGGNINASLRIVAKQSAGSLLQFTEVDYPVSNGVVNFQLEDGLYELWIKQSDTYNLAGEISVSEETTSPAKLVDLLVVS